MKQFKKRTIALVLASVITVAGAFGAERYKNSLMGISFQNKADGQVNMTIQTQKEYTGNVSLIKRAPGMYIMMLPEVNSLAPTPDLKDVAQNIDSIEIRTMPYTTSGNGYTRITVKTSDTTVLSADKTLYVSSEEQAALPAPPPEENPPEIEQEQPEASVEAEQPQPEENQERTRISRHAQEEIKPDYSESENVSDSTNIEQSAEEPLPETANSTVTTATAPNPEDTDSQNPTETFMLVLGFLFIIAASIYFFIRAKNKLAEIAGEQVVIDVDDSDETKKKEKKKEKPKTSAAIKIKKAKNTIKQLDSTYKNPVTMPKNSEYTPSVSMEEHREEEQEEINVVDLDQLYQEKTVSSTEPAETPELSEDDEENQALEDFLSGFSFDEDAFVQQEEETVEEEASGYDEEYYEKTINNDSLVFNKDDTDKVNLLLNTEIQDSTLRNIEEFAESGAAKKIPTKQEILEDLVTTYAVSQNITFTPEDVEALNKLINVEIDPDFITDLKTNPERAREMQAEMEKQKDKPHKTSEILTLNVKDMLPDLSEALRKQGGRKIESEVRPTTVYYSEGYDFATLSLNDALPDLSKELNNAEAYKFKPSDEIQYADTSYQVQKLDISNQIPNLADMLKNPEKYETPKPEPVVVDEEVLLKNISNVTFKPFYDGSRNFEVLNEFDDSKAPSISDVQKEFSQFENFEIANQDEYYNGAQNDYDDFEAFYRNDFVDLDKQYAADKAAGKPKEKSLFETEFQHDINDSVPETLPTQETSETETQEAEKVEIDLNQENNTIETEQEQNDALDNSDSLLEEIAISDEEPTKEEAAKTAEAVSKPVKQEKKPEITQKQPESAKPAQTSLSEELQKRIAQSREDRIARKARIMLKKQEIISSLNNKVEEPKVTCTFNNETYNILSSVNFGENTGCHLAKNKNGYTVFGFIGDKILKIKQYTILKSEKIQARISEKLDDGGARYIVRIGVHKFVVNVYKDKIEYVMDLC